MSVAIYIVINRFDSTSNRNSFIIIFYVTLQHLWWWWLVRGRGNLSLTWGTNSKPQPSNQLTKEEIKSRSTFFLVRETTSLGHKSQ